MRTAHRLLTDSGAIVGEVRPLTTGQPAAFGSCSFWTRFGQNSHVRDRRVEGERPRAWLAVRRRATSRGLVSFVSPCAPRHQVPPPNEIRRSRRPELPYAMARPTFLIIGAMKCGTSSLHYYLRQHPEIQMPVFKELNFFSGPPGDFPYPAGSRRIETLAKYEKLFDPAIKVRGEASPNYTVYPQRAGVPERIKDLIPGAKLIYLVRDPVARTVSQYQLHVSSVGERRSLSDALGDLLDPYSLYTCPSFYAKQLDQYLRWFSQENILVIDQADLLRSRQSTLREIFTFLSVDDSFISPQFQEEMNTSKEHRSHSVFDVIIERARTSPLIRLPRGLRVFLRRSVENLVSRPLEPPTLTDDLRDRLKNLYADDVQRFRELTGKTFSIWSV